MERITYGAPRLVDWVAQIKAGAATVRVHFTGGALTSYGVTPAEYTTANPFIQRVIENSSYFKEGRITTLRRSTIPDKQKLETEATPQARPQGLESAVKTPNPAHAVVDEQETLVVYPTTLAEDVAGETDDNAVSGLTKVKTTCLQDAQAYLQEQFNISSYKVRSYEAAQRVAAEHGIQFVGSKFTTVDNDDASESVITEEDC